MTAEQFEKAIEDKFGSIYDFTEAYFEEWDQEKLLPGFLESLGVTFHADLDKVAYDSYGSEDSKLSRIFFNEEADKYFELYGTRCSYSGEDWCGIREVKKVEEITIKFV